MMIKIRYPVAKNTVNDLIDPRSKNLLQHGYYFHAITWFLKQNSILELA
jgi:hypothetical protein